MTAIVNTAQIISLSPNLLYCLNVDLLELSSTTVVQACRCLRLRCLCIVNRPDTLINLLSCNG